MKVLRAIEFEDFEPWEGAVDTWDKIKKNHKLEELQQLLNDIATEDCKGSTVASVSEVYLNDLLWFEREFVLDHLGIEDK